MRSKGLTLIETLVGIFLTLIVFLGIFGAYQLGLKVIIQSRNKIVATQLANGEIEKIRNLPYGSVGIIGSFPSGSLSQFSASRQNNVDYQVERRVDYVVDALDGLVSPADDCPNDYKKVEIKVSWSGRFSGQVALITDMAPASLAEECSETGGILQVSVFDAQGLMVASPLIEVKNPATNQVVKNATPLSGRHYFSLSPATYKVVVSKAGYSQERTFGTEEVTTPEKPHPIVLEGELIPLSFNVDRLSTIAVLTLSAWGSASFYDSFLNESKIFQIFQLSLTGGQVTLAKVGENYNSSGYLISTTITPENMITWDEFSFSDSEPETTRILYRLLYLEGENWLTIPDRDLPGNESGFEVSPVNLKNLDKTVYPELRIRGDFSTSDPSLTPLLSDWQIAWKTSEATAAPGIPFHLRGEKIIGHNALEEPVFKYSGDHVSDGNGQFTLSSFEWDNYQFSVDPGSSLDLTATEPEPQPMGLAPDTTLQVKLYLKAQTSLLLTSQNNLTLEPIFAAQARLTNAQLGYDVSLYTNKKGQAYFLPLQSATYNLEVAAPGYSFLTTTVSVAGDQTKIVTLEQIE